MSFAEKVLQFYRDLADFSIKLPDGFSIINPYNGAQKALVFQLAAAFYQTYYNDSRPRRLILGSSPARRSTAITGIPFEDMKFLQNETGIKVDKFQINQASSGFLSDVIGRFGGRDHFYANFYMNFVCPLGLTRINSKGNRVNCNYYESRKVQHELLPFIIESLRQQINFGIDTSVCYCIGSGENYQVLTKINATYHFLNTIVPLEHPRFIMQYHSKDRDYYLAKYLTALKQP
ncbi:uracil-DNA glycosylase family protein [Agrilactobacillus fermenti]|uniref:uracil-DNA glycosylase family protein n=1 Tax=Agrilactobacillus fermenti TaxID=2586909 RepID=UPI001E63AD37|nr:uracil-DNA glycosylase family protein [Agrilactobacillus fermenti]MCD2256397.1 DUF4918 family protein [Agrilactobacillus fermenti]